MSPEKKESYLTIRVSKQDLKHYAACAEKVGLSMSAWVRFTLKSAVDASKERKQRAKKVSGG
jgi:predicted HicB family RNase H-like nuclease